jgi:hypothetical protein
MASELPSHRVSLTSSSTEKAKNYIQNREIPQLFEALMTGLMFKQPDDHIDYIMNCLNKIKQPQNQKNQVKWNTFITAGEKENANPMNLSREARLVSGNK